jgi:hypothetical protein
MGVPGDDSNKALVTCADRHTYTRGPQDIELETIFVPSEIAASRQPEFQSMSAEVDETQWHWSRQELGTQIKSGFMLWT